MSGSSLTDRLRFILYLAARHAESRGSAFLEAWDVLLAMSEDQTSPSGRTLATYDIDEVEIKKALEWIPDIKKGFDKKSDLDILADERKKVREAAKSDWMTDLIELYDQRETLTGSKKKWSSDLELHFARALKLKEDLEHSQLGDLHLLLILAEDDPIVRQILDERGVNLTHIEFWLDHELKQASPTDEHAVHSPPSIKNTFKDRCLDRAATTEGHQDKIKLNTRAVRIFRNAINEARSRDHQEVSLRHLVESILDEASLSTPEFHKRNHLEMRGLLSELTKELDAKTSYSSPDKPTSLSARCRHLLTESQSLANSYSTGIIDLQHLSIAVIDNADQELSLLLNKYGFGMALRPTLVTCLNWWNKNRISRDYSALSGSIEEIESSLVAGDDGFESWLSARSTDLLEKAMDEASQTRMCQVEPEHLLLGMLFERASIASDLLIENGIYLKETRQLLSSRRRKGARRTNGYCNLSFNTRRLLDKALELTRSLADFEIEPEHILLALVQEREGLSLHCLTATGLDGEFIEETLRERMQIGARL